MTLESLGPLVEELCAVLHGKGCTVREVSITYSPVVKEDVPRPGSSFSRVDASGNLPIPQGGSKRNDR
jgi:hypothetical protein